MRAKTIFDDPYGIGSIVVWKPKDGIRISRALWETVIRKADPTAAEVFWRNSWVVLGRRS